MPRYEVSGHCTNIRMTGSGTALIGSSAMHFLLLQRGTSSSLMPSIPESTSRLCSPSFGARRALSSSKAENFAPSWCGTGRAPARRLDAVEEAAGAEVLVEEDLLGVEDGRRDDAGGLERAHRVVLVLGLLSSR